jgi:Uma2 family endonuclease
MAVSRDKLHTISEFQEYISQPENTDRLFELINGEIVEVSPGRTNNSALEHILSYTIRLFCEKNDIPCYISGGDGAFEVNGHVVAPDFAYKRTPMSDEYPDPIAPEWAIEIISPTDQAPKIRDKRNIYIEAEILYGELYPESLSMDVYTPGQPKRTIDINGILDGGDALPGFSIPLKEIFSRL